MSTLHFKDCNGTANECKQPCKACTANFTQARHDIREAIGGFTKDEEGASSDLAAHLSEFIQMDKEGLTIQYTGNIKRKTSP